MRELQSGIFETTETLPRSPSDIGPIHPYCLVGRLQRAEPEEAAARILTFSQNLGQWVGVSWKRLVEQMHTDYKLDREGTEALREYDRRCDVRQRHIVRSNLALLLIAVASIGLGLAINPIVGVAFCFIFVALHWSILGKMTPKKPVAPVRPNLPMSVIYFMGPQAVVNGIHELVKLGMLRTETIGAGDEEQTIFFPTAQLVTHLAA
ncbi:hypothetical protein EXS71_03400 [Candidatus Uhrbacteria bacterium]|nr:hypothetical protein [Candidatus Uhrbacteria bacterium]